MGYGDKNSAGVPGKGRAFLLVLLFFGFGGLLSGQTESTADSRTEPAIQQEQEHLRGMIQEEKLAKDVYLTLHRQWGLQAFENIARAESRHRQAVRNLLDRKGIDDPTSDDAIGVFVDQKFVDLYVRLTQKGSGSLVSALQVGLEIEEMDITDLRKAKASTTDPAILSVYENLERGSRNHLRAFAGQLKANGGTYAPTHLSPDDFASIESSPQEAGGPGNGQNGKGRGRRSRRGGS